MGITDFEISFKENREIISLGHEKFEFEVGDLSFLLISSPDYLITHLLQFFRNQKEIIAETLQAENINGNLAEELKFIKAKDNTIYSFVEFLAIEYNQVGNSKIGKFFFLFSFAEILMGYRNHYGYESMSERYPSYRPDIAISPLERAKLSFIEGINEVKNKPKETIQNVLFPTKKNSITYNERVYRATEYIMWVIFYGEFLSIEQKDIDIFLDAITGYCDNMINNLIKIRYLKPQLKAFINSLNNKELKVDSMPQWLLLELNQRRNPDIPLSLTAAISLEQEHLYNRKKNTRVCVICKRLFVAHSKTSKYCSEPNPEYGDKTCQEIGRNQGYESKMKLYPYFDSKRKVYCNWMKKQHKIRPDIFESVSASAIEKQLKLNYEEWVKQARKALHNYELNKIMQEEAEAIIDLPDIEFRSQLLYIKSHK